MCKNDSFPLQYQIADFDETKNELIEHDLQSATVEMSLFTASGTLVTSDIICEIIDSSHGWVQNTFDQTATPGMYIVKFKVTQNDTVKYYPCIGDQWINVTGVSDE